MATASRLLTYEDWLALPPVGEGREEVVNGELVVLPPNKVTHAEVVQNLTFSFSKQVERKRVAVLGSNFNLLIGREPLTSRVPDLALFWRETMRVDENDVVCSPPDLLIEVLSPSENKRRKQRKLEDYEKIGVPEVWIVAPDSEIVEVRILKDARLAVEKIVTDGVLEPSRFPGVKISVPEIWPE